MKEFKGWSRVGRNGGGQGKPGPACKGLREGVQGGCRWEEADASPRIAAGSGCTTVCKVAAPQGC